MFFDSQHVFHVVLLLCHPYLGILHWCYIFLLQSLSLPFRSLTCRSRVSPQRGDTVLSIVGMVARVLDTLAVSGAAHPHSVAFVSVDVVPDKRYLALHRAKFQVGVAFRLCHACTLL